ncbi:hypothetical protein AgCh_023813 [Apium graveolens]
MSVEEVVGSLKALEERLRGTTEKGQGQLLFTGEEWRKKESSDGQLLLTRDEWQKWANREGTRGGGNTRGIRDKRRVWCFNCQCHGHFAVECRRLRKERETPKEANMSNVQEDEPALLIAEVGQTDNEVMLLKEDALMEKLQTNIEGQRESQVWYLDNGASNHMTGQRGKFKELDERVSGKVKIGDGSTVCIMRKGTVAF